MRDRNAGLWREIANRARNVTGKLAAKARKDAAKKRGPK